MTVSHAVPLWQELSGMVRAVQPPGRRHEAARWAIPSVLSDSNQRL